MFALVRGNFREGRREMDVESWAIEEVMSRSLKLGVTERGICGAREHTGLWAVPARACHGGR